MFSLVDIDFTNNSCIDETFHSNITRPVGSYNNFQGSRFLVEKFVAKCFMEPNPFELQCSLVFRCDFGFCCEMDDVTVIKSVDTVISPSRGNDIRPHRLDMNVNSRVEFLPTSSDYLKSLIIYEAKECSIKSIWKENFKGMVWLEKLDLAGNLIETIRTDTFEELFKLETISLGEFRLQ